MGGPSIVRAPCVAFLKLPVMYAKLLLPSCRVQCDGLVYCSHQGHLHVYAPGCISILLSGHRYVNAAVGYLILIAALLIGVEGVAFHRIGCCMT